MSKIILLTLMVAAAAATVQTQTTTVPIGPTKVAVIDTRVFTSSKAGITRLVKALNTLETEFRPRRDELESLKVKYDQLVKEINSPPPGADRNTLAAKAEQAQALQTEMNRKQEDARLAYEKRAEALLGPLNTAVFTALDAYAKQQKIDVLLDSAKLEGVMLVTNNAIDITEEFIKDYNGKNP
jgi:Skp family chaperone for outer membrane proteins